MTAQTSRRPGGGTRALAGLAGVLAAAVALAGGELVAGLIGPESSPVVAVGRAVVPLVPEGLKEAAVRALGSADKAVLLGGVLVVAALVAALTGVLGAGRRRAGDVGVVLLGAVGGLAALTRPDAVAADGLPSLVAAVVGVLVLRALLDRLPGAEVAAPAADLDGPPDDDAGPAGDDDDARVVDRLRTTLSGVDRTRLDRRGFLAAGAVAAGAAVIAGGGGRLLQRRSDVAAQRAAVVLPRPASPAPALPAGADLAPGVPGLTPLITSNADFYRVDTALTVPQIRPSTWRLALTGMLDAPRTLTLDDLLARRDVVERDITLTCVSNEVGGDLISTARWTGVPLAAVLREAGIRPGSTQLVCRSTDGMTIGVATRTALTTPDAMLAFGMNGEPLPTGHGFPVRVLVPGVYGYASACKWVTSIEATTFDAYDAYWVERGYAREAPVKTGSRIDTPRPGSSVAAGRRAVAGVAWAQGRGISAVEVQVDDGPWTPARLSPAAEADIWRQWVLPVELDRGQHRLTVRATDGTGARQTADRVGIVPDGATGWHSVTVRAA